MKENKNKLTVSRAEKVETRSEGQKLAKEMKVERGVETLFKTASRNHMQLSSMADSKAHILLTINSILISIVISVLSKRVEQNYYLIWPNPD